ncbi:MAG: hypothetical protein ACREP6_06990, partial [Candidatus Binataceae bacterium]
MAVISQRLRTLQALLSERILILDGATGTSIQAMRLGATDFGAVHLEGCNENLVMTVPERMRAL